MITAIEWTTGTKLPNNKSTKQFQELDTAVLNYFKYGTFKAYEVVKQKFDAWCKKPFAGPGWTWAKSDRNKTGVITKLVGELQLDPKVSRVRQDLNSAARFFINDNASFGVISKLMCWDAAIYFAFRAGLIDTNKYQALVSVNPYAPNNLVGLHDHAAEKAQEMRQIPAGHIIGYFSLEHRERPELVHAMVSLGGGHAAGNKNDCIGIGMPAGWEILDLGGLKWVTGQKHFTSQGRLVPQRDVIVRYRHLA